MRPGRLPGPAGLGAGRLRRARRGADPEVQDRPVQDHPGPERDRLRADRRAAAGRRLHHPDPPRPHLHQRQDPWGGRTPSAPRGVAQHVAAGRDLTLARALRRRRRGEDDRRLSEGLRLPLRDRGPLAPQPHDPQPHAGGDRGLHGLRDRLRAGDLTRGEAHTSRAPGVDGRDERQPVPGLRRQEGRGQRGPLHLPRRRSRRLRRSEAQRVDGRSGRRADRHGRATFTRVGFTPTSRSGAVGPGFGPPAAAPGQARPLAGGAAGTRRGAAAIPPISSVRRPSTTSRPGRCPGTCR